MSVTITSQTLIAGKIGHNFEAAPPMELWLDGEPVNARPSGPLQPVAPGPWRSMGRYLDYTNWADRDRFVELDRAIEANAELERAEESYEETQEWPETSTADSPFAIWGLRPIGGLFKTSRRHGAIQ